MEEVERSEPSGEAADVLPSPRDLDRDMRAVEAAVAIAEREEAAMVLPRRASSAGDIPALRGAPASAPILICPVLTLPNTASLISTTCCATGCSLPAACLSVSVMPAACWC